MGSSVREIVKVLEARYKQSEQFQELKQAPVKGRIEEWIIGWENLRGRREEMKVAEKFGSETIFAMNFSGRGGNG